MALYAAWTRLETDLDLLSTHIRDFAAGKPSLDASAHFSLREECLLEGILSRVWQVWNSFCRNCVVESCMGTVDAAGLPITGIPDARSEAHVSSAAIVAKKKPAPPYWGQTNTVLRFEPTWGDTDVLTSILTRLGPHNSSALLPAISTVHAKAKALQTIRNGAAHNHAQNLAEIQSLRSAYIAFPISHPTHAMFWIEPQSRDFLITDVINELKDEGLTAIS
jgi:hypothetical protein